MANYTSNLNLKMPTAAENYNVADQNGNMIILDAAVTGKVQKPATGNGSAGQVLKTNGDGTTKWENPQTPTDAQVAAAVSAWLISHPEATTTVQDGAISRAKLDNDLKAKTDPVPNIGVATLISGDDYVISI